MTVQLKVIKDQEKGYEYIQIPAGFRHKVFLGSYTWAKILEWFEGNKAEPFEYQGVHISCVGDKTTIKERDNTVTLEHDDTIALCSLIEEKLYNPKTQAATPPVNAEVAATHQSISSKPSKPDKPEIEIYSPYMTPVHREISITCGKCALHIDLNSKDSLSGKAAICPQCKSILILIDKTQD